MLLKGVGSAENDMLLLWLLDSFSFIMAYDAAREQKVLRYLKNMTNSVSYSPCKQLLSSSFSSSLSNWKQVFFFIT
jgi:hypothetical protein